MNEGSGSGSFGPYREVFEEMRQELRNTRHELVEFRIEMASFEGKVLGAARAWSAAIALIGIVISVVATSIQN